MGLKERAVKTNTTIWRGTLVKKWEMLFTRESWDRVSWRDIGTNVESVYIGIK